MSRPPRIVVLMGGVSTERAVSFRSGRAVTAALLASGFETIPVVANDTRLRVLAPDLGDAVFIALHGTFGEDGELQDLLDARGIPYTGSGAGASRLAFDKAAAREALGAAGLPIAPGFAAPRDTARIAILEEAAAVTGFPLFVKPARQGSSVGVSRVEGPDSLDAALDEAFRHDDTVVIERFEPGLEVTVGILEEEPLPVIAPRPADGFYDYHAKYEDAGTRYLFPTDLPRDAYEAIQTTAAAAHRALGCRDVSRVDLILGADGVPRILEVNTVPGFTGASLLPKAARAAGFSFEGLCARVLAPALARGRVRGIDLRKAG